MNQLVEIAKELDISEEDLSILSMYGSGLKWIYKSFWDRYPDSTIDRFQYFIDRFIQYMKDYPDMNPSADFDVIVQSILTSTELLFDKNSETTEDNVKLRRELRASQRTLSASRHERQQVGRDAVKLMVDVSKLTKAEEYRKLYEDSSQTNTGQIESPVETETRDTA